MYNFVNGSPHGWEILKNVVKFSLRFISTTRWSAQIKAVKPVTNHLFNIMIAVEVAELLNIQPYERSDLHSIR